MVKIRDSVQGLASLATHAVYRFIAAFSRHPRAASSEVSCATWPTIRTQVKGHKPAVVHSGPKQHAAWEMSSRAKLRKFSDIDLRVGLPTSPRRSFQEVPPPSSQLTNGVVFTPKMGPYRGTHEVTTDVFPSSDLRIE